MNGTLSRDSSQQNDEYRWTLSLVDFVERFELVVDMSTNGEANVVTLNLLPKFKVCA